MKKIYPILLIAWIALPTAVNASLREQLESSLTKALQNQCIPSSDEYCSEFSRAIPNTATDQCLCPCDFQFYDEDIRACINCPIATTRGSTACGDTSCSPGHILAAYEESTTCKPGFISHTIQQTCGLSGISSEPSSCPTGFGLTSV